MTVPPPSAPDDLEQALRASRGLEDAPESVIRRAIDLWQPRTAAERSGSVLQRWIATLRFDSAAAGTPALGLRAGPSDATRQLLYTAEDRDIDLRIDPQPDGGWRVSGQVLGPDSAGTAELHCDAAAAQQVPWSELAEFEFAPVPAGRCVLTLRSADWEISLPPFDTGRAP
jgi:hypothetical protein